MTHSFSRIRWCPRTLTANASGDFEDFKLLNTERKRLLTAESGPFGPACVGCPRLFNWAIIIGGGAWVRLSIKNKEIVVHGDRTRRSQVLMHHTIELSRFILSSRHPGQGPRDPAVPVPEIWDRDRNRDSFKNPGPGLNFNFYGIRDRDWNLRNPGPGTGTGTHQKIRDRGRDWIYFHPGPRF